MRQLAGAAVAFAVVVGALGCWPFTPEDMATSSHVASHQFTVDIPYDEAYRRAFRNSRHDFTCQITGNVFPETRRAELLIEERGPLIIPWVYVFLTFTAEDDGLTRVAASYDTWCIRPDLGHRGPAIIEGWVRTALEH